MYANKTTTPTHYLFSSTSSKPRAFRFPSFGAFSIPISPELFCWLAQRVARSFIPRTPRRTGAAPNAPNRAVRGARARRSVPHLPLLCRLAPRRAPSSPAPVFCIHARSSTISARRRPLEAAPVPRRLSRRRLLEAAPVAPPPSIESPSSPTRGVVILRRVRRGDASGNRAAGDACLTSRA